MTGYERPPVNPDRPALERFWRQAIRDQPTLKDAGGYTVRMIGWDEASTEQVLQMIASRDKTGTFTLPWLVEVGERAAPAVGDVIIFVDWHGQPRCLCRLTDIRHVTFGAIDATHTALDGPPVRDLAVWKPLHTRYWNAALEPFGLRVSDAMPVLVEAFELMAAAPHGPGRPDPPDA